jgi:hypothetical protein
MMKRLFALAVGCIAALISAYFLTTYSTLAHDFTYPWQAAKMLRAGVNPYAPAVLIAPLPAGWAPDPLFYPLPAVLLALPFSFLSAPVAGALFAGCGAGLLAYALPKHLYPALLSVPMLFVVRGGNWSTWIMAAALLPWLGAVLLCKPTLGAALWLRKPTRTAVVIGAAFALVSIAVLPTWPLDWLRNTAQLHHPIPLLTLPFGPLLLLALLRWRDPRARLVLAMACIPQLLLFYDQLPLFLACRTRKQAALLACCSWLAWLLWQGSEVALVVPLLYLPALIMALRAEKSESRSTDRQPSEQRVHSHSPS